MRYSSLFEPITVGGVELKNRIVRSAHGTLLTGEGLIAYHESEVRGWRLWFAVWCVVARLLAALAVAPVVRWMREPRVPSV